MTKVAAATESVNPRTSSPLVNNMDESPWNQAASAVKEGPFHRSDFSIGHRGAAMQFPEHTKESYLAAIQMGVGVVEDVTFTKDKELVCRTFSKWLRTP